MKLLRTVADSIEQLGDVRIQDLVLHNEITVEGAWPSITVYYHGRQFVRNFGAATISKWQLGEGVGTCSAYVSSLVMPNLRRIGNDASMPKTSSDAMMPLPMRAMLRAR